MKVAIFSDSHDNLPNLEKFLAWVKANNIDQLIFCGDLAAPSVIKKVIAPAFSGPIHMVFGNVGDRDLEPEIAKEFPQIKHYGDTGEFVIDGNPPSPKATERAKKIAITHRPQQATELAKSGKYDFVFYGHTHKPWEEKVGNCRLVNPGTLAGMFYKASFAVYDTQTDKLELKILEQI